MSINKKIIIISLSFGLILLFLIIFGIFPILKNIKEDSKKLSQGKEELAIIKNKIENSGPIKEIYQKIDPSFQKIDGLFVDPQLPIDLIKFWEKTAAESNISISISNITLQNSEGKESKKDFWDSLKFQMVLDGSFSGFSKFLEKIENSPYLTELQDITIKKITGGEVKNSKQQPSSSNVSVLITLKAFTK